LAHARDWVNPEVETGFLYRRSRPASAAFHKKPPFFMRGAFMDSLRRN
jgi:hypothetical protein